MSVHVPVRKIRETHDANLQPKKKKSSTYAEVEIHGNNIRQSIKFWLFGKPTVSYKNCYLFNTLLDKSVNFVERQLNSWNIRFGCRKCKWNRVMKNLCRWPMILTSGQSPPFRELETKRTKIWKDATCALFEMLFTEQWWNKFKSYGRQNKSLVWKVSGKCAQAQIETSVLRLKTIFIVCKKKLPMSVSFWR